MLLEEKQKMKKEKVLLDTRQAFMNRVGFSPPKLTESNRRDRRAAEGLTHLFGEPYARYETTSMKGRNK